MQERDYWEGVLDHLQAGKDTYSVKDLLSIVSHLKQFGLLKTPFLRQVLEQVMSKYKQLTTHELVLFTMVYTSDIARAAMVRD